MTKLKLGISALVVVGTATALVLQHQATEKLRGANEALTQQLAQLQTESESFSNRLAAAGESKKLPDEQFRELLKLRGEVGVLRRQTNELGKLREENQRLRTVKADTKKQEQAIADSAKQEQEAIMQKINNARQGILAFIMFAADYTDQFPTNISQVSYLLKGDYLPQVETNFTIAYKGSISNITNPSGTIVLKENQAWQSLNGKWMKTYGFADGHAELHTEPSGNFDEWEKQHTAPPTSNQ